MDQSRFISKIVERSLFDYYSQGVLAPHAFPLRSRHDYNGDRVYQDVDSDPLRDDDEDLVEERDAVKDAVLNGMDPSGVSADVRKFWSWSDAEAVLSSTNAIQSDHGLNDFISQFKDNIYRDGENDVSIKAAKITYPHNDIAKRHNIISPHPSMTDDELKKYVWPMSYLNRTNESYMAALWIDVGESDIDFTEQDDYGNFDVRTTTNTYWRRVMDLPIQIGSNRCNLAVMRSYLGDDTFDDVHMMTWGERARQFLEGYIDANIRWEPLVPDGYFIIKGKMKRINISDKLMMNMSYVVKQSTSAEYGKRNLTPVRERAVEVRSVRTDLGLAYLRIILIAPSKDELKPQKGMNLDVFKFYNSTLQVMIDKEFMEPINLFDLVRGYGVVVLGMTDTDQPMNDLLDCLREYSHNDREIMRIAIVSKAKAGNQDVQTVINQYRRDMLASQNRGIDQQDQSNQELIAKMRRKLLPHCETGDVRYPSEEDIRESYNAKIKFLAMMIIDLILCVTYKQGSKEYRKEPTDRKDFSYKRWEAYGHRQRDHIRSMLVPRTQFRGRSTEREQYYGTVSINSMDKAAKQLIDFMNRNQWPVKYRLGGTFKAKKDEHKDGIVDDVPKYNLISMIDSLRTVKISTKGGPNTSSIRRVQTSQWGQQCPANTPENANIGLNNNMAETCLITNDLSHVEKDSLEDVLSSLYPSELSQGGYLLEVDGNPRGYVTSQSYDVLKDARRSGQINIGIGIARHYRWSKELPPGIPVIIVRTSHGRPIFPVFVIDQSYEKLQKILSLTEREIDDAVEVDGHKSSFQYLIAEGLVQFIDAYELVFNAVVAPWIYTVATTYDTDGTIPYTHAMIKPGHILSQASNCLSFIEHNPAARGTYATQHVKQAIGRPFLHPEDRYDHETNYLFNPEPPLITTDTLRRLLYPPSLYQPEGGIQPRDVGIGRNVNIICMSFDGNNDDGLIISQSLYDSGVFDGEHFNITTSDRSIIPSSVDAYDWLIDGDTKKDIRDDRGQGIPDPDFSASVVVPYGDPYIVDVPEEIFLDRESIPMLSIDGQNVYELRPGELYLQNGFYTPSIITYLGNNTNQESQSIVLPGDQPINIPNRTIVQVDKGQRIRRLALAYVNDERYNEYRRGSLNRQHRPTVLNYEQLLGDPGIIDTRFISRVDVPVLDGTWYASSEGQPIPRTQLPGMLMPTRSGRTATIRPRRPANRGDTAIKIMKRKDGTFDSEVINPKGEKDRFEITHGVVDGIGRGTPMKIRSSMPIDIKPGNKYAALYAQKSVVAYIAPNSQMPKARWYNEVLERWEEMTFDVVFNPLSFPSRMTIGMEYEIFIAGVLRYLYGISVDDTTLGEMYRSNRQAFDEYMNMTYQVRNAATLIDELSDSTCFVYNNEDKYFKCRDLRAALGIPSTGLYDVYLRADQDTEYTVNSASEQEMNSVVRDLPDHAEWTRRIETPIVCGTVYYVALRHLVDNKRRARGYVGRKDPMSLQPVKGRRKNGGANTGTMETDAYKAHGAGGMLLERLSRVSDHKQFLKCSLCGGLVSRIGTNNTFRCVDCQKVLQPQEVIEHDTVNSWQLFRNYLRPLGIEVYETFE